MIGLSWGLFVAGVPAEIVSQWKVESASTAKLLVEFHRQLLQSRNGFAPPDALRAAALKLMKMPAYRHPFYWAAFIALGLPRAGS